jgi:hypothetical protein
MPDDNHRDLTFITDTVAPLKPSLRGWLHAGTFPLALLAGLVLVLLASSPSALTAATIFTVASSLLFGVSALYHRLHWKPGTQTLLRRVDHSNIFLMIAGTYTPFGILLLRGTDRVVLLAAAWGGAVLGVLFRVFWVEAPRWLYTPIYLALLAPGLLPPRWRRCGHPAGDRGAAVLTGSAGLRPQAARSVSPLVRLPRGVPRLHSRGVRRPLCRREHHRPRDRLTHSLIPERSTPSTIQRWRNTNITSSGRMAVESGRPECRAAEDADAAVVADEQALHLVRGQLLRGRDQLVNGGRRLYAGLLPLPYSNTSGPPSVSNAAAVFLS